MGFTWSTNMNPGSQMTQEQINELYSNMNQIANAIGLSEVAAPNLRYQQIRNQHLMDIRNRVDYLRSQNYCRTYKATDNDTNNTTRNYTVDASCLHLGGPCPGNNTYY